MRARRRDGGSPNHRRSVLLGATRHTLNNPPAMASGHHDKDGHPGLSGGSPEARMTGFDRVGDASREHPIPADGGDGAWR